jgi:four helix bundle protein
MKNFKELKIWQKGMDIAVQSYQLTNTFPSAEKYSISAQINRAGVSIPSNIAEGSSRSSEKDYGRFIEIALGSCFELETQLLIAQRLQFADSTQLSNLLNEVSEEEKMLNGFLKSLFR